MTRAEEAALKAYPIHFTNMYMPDGLIVKIDINTEPRKLYQKVYEQAEKDTIERAIMWLEKHADEYNGSESSFDHMEEEMITDFRKAMEEE